MTTNTPSESDNQNRLKSALQALQKMRAKLEKIESARSEPIAVVGIRHLHAQRREALSQAAGRGDDRRHAIGLLQHERLEDADQLARKHEVREIEVRAQLGSHVVLVRLEHREGAFGLRLHKFGQSFLGVIELLLAKSAPPDEPHAGLVEKKRLGRLSTYYHPTCRTSMPCLPDTVRLFRAKAWLRWEAGFVPRA